jgi:hypothetical protein
MKTCIKCGTEKPLFEFHKKKTSKDGLNCYCKPCAIQRAKEWANKNPDKLLDRVKRWAKENPERRREIVSRWEKNNKGKANAKTARRYASKTQATPVWSEKDKIDIVYEKAAVFKLSVDHIVPLRSDKVCGLHCWNNLQLLAQGPNSQKSNKYWPDMWEEEMYGSEAA